MMHTWFEGKIRYEKVAENGMNKKVTEPYLVDALSFTEAEARLIEEVTPFITGEFTVTDIKRRADTAGNILRRKTTALQRLLCRRDGQRGGGFFLRTPVAGADAGAGGDPLVAGIHGAAQLFVGDRAAGQSPAGGDQTQTLHAFLISPI